MADRGDTHYHVPHLNRWFSFAAILLLVSSFWMVIDDWNSPWKSYQREFRALDLERVEAELATEEAQAAMRDEMRLAEKLDQAESQLEGKRSELDELEEQLRLLKGERFTAIEKAKKAKQEYNWERYLIEEHRAHYDEPDYRQDELEEFELRMLDSAGVQELIEIKLAEVENQLTEMRAGITSLESDVKQAGKSIDLARKKRDKLDPQTAPEKLANFLRDFPGLDFVGPNLKVEKVVLDDLTFELNFTKKKRIDMCMTCHVPISLEGYDGEDLEQPLRSHPRLDLFLTAKSPHPMNKVGCTICHRGAGEALDFQRSDHYTSDVAMQDEWYEEYHWHKQHYWDYPMLDSKKIEASCVQCHKTSMELIADEAPTVTEGYRQFERYGCYACHKVEWFPTKRRPGPSLKNIQAKTNADFVDAWIANPKAFRPTTWMPQFFHLENYAPEAEVVISEYGEGRSIKGQEWNDSAVSAITAFLMDRAPKRQLPDIPVDGDPERGREVMRVTGCLACHNMAGYPGTETETMDLAFEVNDSNQHGPNLRGVGSKVDQTWLYWWLKDPVAMWPETRMPNLRLEDQDAADIAAYIVEDPDGVFTEVPEGWEPGPSPSNDEVLREQARWYFSRASRDELRARFAGEREEFRWDRTEDLKVAVGEKLVTASGCYSCHAIEGMEDLKPIGTELTSWGSKTVDKLDWGLLPSIFAEQHGWDEKYPPQHYRDEVYKPYRDNWIAQKLDEPRSFDRQKIKSPTERLKMPWFNFREDQIQEISTFVIGLVDDEVQRAKMEPTADEMAMDTGLRAIRQQNCTACHVIEPSQVTFLDGDGVQRTVEAELLSMDGYADAWMHPTPPMTSMEALNEYLAEYEEVLDEEVDEIGFRLLGNDPDVGGSGENIFVDRENLLAVAPPWGGDFVDLITNYYIWGIELFDSEAPEDEALYPWTADPDGEGAVQDVDGEFRTYYEEQVDKLRWTFAPPVLYDEGGKLQKDWFYAFLKDPMPLRQQIRVRMPSFNFPEGHAGAIADAFALMSKQSWPTRYARDFRHAQEMSLEEMSDATGLSVKAIEGIESGSKPDIEASFPNLMAYAMDADFRYPGAVDPDHERLLRRSASYLDQVHAGHPDYLVKGRELAVEGPQCFSCHFDGEIAPPADPLAWAPDLSLTRERLREDWVVRWLTDPSKIYPGTSMPANFLSDPPQYQEILPGSTNQEQINAITDWLFNYDRANVAE